KAQRRIFHMGLLSLFWRNLRPSISSNVASVFLIESTTRVDAFHTLSTASAPANVEYWLRYTEYDEGSNFHWICACSVHHGKRARTGAEARHDGWPGAVRVGRRR